MFFVSLLIFALPGAHAASVKVDVCHSEGNGSFHLISISDKAVPAHRRHGDALPGEGVPGAPGNEFDEFCDQVLASTCPCDFSATGLAEISLDGFGDEDCIDRRGGIFVAEILISAIAEVVDDSTSRICPRVLGIGQGNVEKFTGSTDEQIDDCIIDLQQADACQP